MEQYPRKKRPEFTGPAAFAANVFKLVGGIIDPIPHARQIKKEDDRAKEHQDEVITDLTDKIEARIQEVRQFEQEVKAAKARHPSNLPAPE